MVEIQQKAESTSGETEKIISEYRERIKQSLEQECHQLKTLAENESRSIIASAYQEAASITARAQEEAQQIIEKAKTQADQEIERITTEARSKAEQIITQAEERAKKEATDKKKREVQRIEQEAWEESRNIVAEARAGAEKTAQKIIKDAKEKARRDAQEESLRIVAGAKKKVQIERDRALASAMTEIRRNAEVEAGQVIKEAQTKAKEIVASAKDKAQYEFEDSARLFSEIKQKLEQVNNIYTKQSEMSKHQVELEPTEATAEKKEEDGVTIFETEITNQDPILENERNEYQGTLIIKVLPPVDFIKMERLEKHLSQTPQIKITGKGGDDDGTPWLRLEVDKPLPLVKLIKKIPMVKDVFAVENSVHVLLNAKHQSIVTD